MAKYTNKNSKLNKRQAMQVSQIARKTIGRMSETKRRNENVQKTSLTTGAALGSNPDYYLAEFTNISSGNTSADRIGNKIKVIGIHSTGYVENTDDTDRKLVRMSILKVHNNDLADAMRAGATLSGLFEDNNSSSALNSSTATYSLPYNTEKVTVLWDSKKVVEQANDSTTSHPGSVKQFNKFLKLRYHAEFNTSSNTTCERGATFFLAWANTSQGPPAIPDDTLKLNCMNRIWFKDL